MTRLLDAVLTQPIPQVNGEFGHEQDVLLVPDGTTTYPDKTKLLVDEEAERHVQAAFDQQGVELPVDINHATQIKMPHGDEAPAYGWISRVWREPGTGIMCHVKWTEEGHEHIAKRRYRYLSPVAKYHPETNRVHRIDSAALTTRPATPRMPALAATRSFFTEEIESMDGLLTKMMQEGGAVVATAEQKMGELKAWLEANGAELGDGADFVAIINAALEKLKGGGGEPSEEEKENAEIAATLRSKLGCDAGAGKDAVLTQLDALQGHVGYVQAEEHTKLLARVDELEGREKQRHAEDLVETYVKEGKLLTNDDKQMAWALKTATDDPDGFKTIMANAPVVVPQGRTEPPARGSAGTSGDHEDKLIEASLAEHDGNHRDAMLALQGKLIDEEVEKTGHARNRAAQNLKTTYPKIFGP